MATSGRRETKKKAICFSSPPDAQLNAPGPVTSREKRNTHAKKTNKKNHNETNPRQLGKHSLRARSHCRFTEFFFFYRVSARWSSCTDWLIWNAFFSVFCYWSVEKKKRKKRRHVPETEPRDWNGCESDDLIGQAIRGQGGRGGGGWGSRCHGDGVRHADYSSSFSSPIPAKLSAKRWEKKEKKRTHTHTHRHVFSRKQSDWWLPDRRLSKFGWNGIAVKRVTVYVVVGTRSTKRLKKNKNKTTTTTRWPSATAIESQLMDGQKKNMITDTKRNEWLAYRFVRLKKAETRVIVASLTRIDRRSMNHLARARLPTASVATLRRNSVKKKYSEREKKNNNSVTSRLVSFFCFFFSEENPTEPLRLGTNLGGNSVKTR